MTAETMRNDQAPGTLFENNPHKDPPGSDVTGPKKGTGVDTEWCAEKAAEAMRYLAVNCPASSGSPELHPHQDEAHAAAVAGDGPRYLEALRAYVRCGQDIQRRARKGAA